MQLLQRTWSLEEGLPKEGKERFSCCCLDDSSSENDLVVAIGEQPQQYYEQWVLDSGCSYHMCPHKNGFVTYEEKCTYG